MLHLSFKRVNAKHVPIRSNRPILTLIYVDFYQLGRRIIRLAASSSCSACLMNFTFSSTCVTFDILQKRIVSVTVFERSWTITAWSAIELCRPDGFAISVLISSTPSARVVPNIQLLTGSLWRAERFNNNFPASSIIILLAEVD